MKLIRRLIIAAMVVILLGFTVFFVLDAYNTGEFGNKAGKISDDFTEQLVGAWTGKYSISEISFEDDGTTSLTLLGVELKGEFEDSYDLEKEEHTLRIKYISSLGVSVEKYFKAELSGDTLTLTDTQLDSVKMVYTRGSKAHRDGAEDKKTTESTTFLPNQNESFYKEKLIGTWSSTASQNSGYEFREDMTVNLKLLGIGYDGNYSVYIEEGSNRCVLKINYISVGDINVNNSYYVNIEDDTLTLTQKGAETLKTTYNKVN